MTTTPKMPPPIFPHYANPPQTPGFQDIDYGFQPSWAAIPQVSIFDPSNTVSRDQVLGTVRRPIWQEAEDSFQREEAAKRIALTQELRLQADLDRSHYLALSSVATVWNVVSGVASAVGTGLGYAGKVFYAVNSGVGRARRYVVTRGANRYDPIGRRRSRRVRVEDGSEDSDLETDEESGTQSMLSMPPHMVGATPKVVRQSRRMARSAYTAPSVDFEPTNTTQPIRRGPKTPGGKKLRVRFEGDASTPGRSSTNAPNTPAFVFNTPKDKKMNMSKKDEFQMNVNKEKFNTWMKVLHNSRWRRGDVRASLTKFELPTKLINTLYEKREEDPEPWEALVASHSHNGFLTRSGLVIPTVDVTKHKHRDWEAESELDGKVSSESLIQQKDGKCKICRGFKWAGIILTREISEGEEVPCHSQHKSVKPYTAQELREFSRGDHDSLFRRWCQESRWDWLFEDPPLSGLDKDGNEWVIPGDDPRLRHVTRLNELGKCYDADRLDLYLNMKKEFSRQDLAAKRFISAIERAGNPTVAHQLKQMDIERKRRQVEVKFLCVRQVKIVIKGANSTTAHLGKRTASAADLHPENNKKQRTKNPTPKARRIATMRNRKPLVKTHGNGKQTASIVPPTVLEPLQRIPAPFDPVELKKIRLAPPTPDDAYKAPETIFRERFEEERRFAPRFQREGTYSAREEDFAPPSREELEAEIFFENCKKAETIRVEEEKLRAKEIEEEKDRARGKSGDGESKTAVGGGGFFRFGEKGATATTSMWD